LRLSLPKFTVIGATTRLALLTSPLRDRFGLVQRMEFYSVDALNDIVVRAGRILRRPNDSRRRCEIAARGRGTPRIVNRLLRRVRDYAQVVADGVITQEVAVRSLTSLEIDHSLALDENDRRLMRAIIEMFGGLPVGLSTLAAALAEEVDAVEDVYEPFLLQLGMLHRTPRGRVVTRRAYEHLCLYRPDHAGEGKTSEQRRFF
jgi:Holliday junction DNA helicase RuvB